MECTRLDGSSLPATNPMIMPTIKLMTDPASGDAPVHRLQHFPISFFAVVMGLAGLSIATHRVELHLGMAAFASLAIAAAAALVFVTVAAIYATKLVRHPKAVLADWHHPVRLSFFPTVSISLLLLSLIVLTALPSVALVLWGIGTALHLYATLVIVSAWIGPRPFEPPQLNPVWFIPAVGNILVPLAGVPLGFVEIGWLFFATGLTFWIVLMTLVFNRLIFHHPLPERLLPTLMILVAPPAVAFLSYLRLTGGGLDPFARILFYAAIFLFLLVAMQARRLVRLPFALSWWAYSFPLAALTTATAVYAAAAGSTILTAVFIGFYLLLCVVIAVLAIHTAGAICRGEICRPET
jgi:tellurite resistance protein